VSGGAPAGLAPRAGPGRPIPTRRALALAALGLVPAALSAVWTPLAALTLLLDGALLALVLVDFLRAPRAEALRVSREVAPVLSAGVPNRVRLRLERPPGASGVVTGELRDVVGPGPRVDRHRRAFAVSGEAIVEYLVTPLTRGDLRLGPVAVRLEGPLGLCARQLLLPVIDDVRVFPDLTALTRDALALARATDDAARRVVRVRAEGREFESLRDYRPGDDRRSIDWKATARRARPMVRVHQPERNQRVLVLLDCGRHMAGEVDGRRKLDHAVDAALRVARVSLDRGDLVGVLAYGASVQSWLPPRRGGEHLNAIARALYRVEATLEESDLGAALELAFAQGARRSLVLVLTDVFDAESSAALVRRTQRLVPRHLPLIVSLRDDAVHRAATRAPADRAEAYERFVAGRLEDETLATITRLRDAGAHVLRVSPAELGAATVGAYLDLKGRGLL
jgi:uncharacterized protein (DUF58 family)